MIRLYECPKHDQDFYQHPECPDCVRIVQVDTKQREINARVQTVAKVPYQPSWGKQAEVDGGRWIHHLTPKPVFVRSKGELRDLMKRTNAMEK